VSSCEEASVKRRVDHHHHEEDDFTALGVLVVIMTISLSGLTMILLFKNLISP
jgi:hypothetical protein